MTRPISLATPTGHVFARTHGITGSQWPWITETITHEFGCDADDLALDDDDQTVMLAGQPLAVIGD